MRFVSWNCGGNFAEKYEGIADFDDPYGDDVLVVQHAEQPDRLPDRLLGRYPNHVWVGDDPEHGLLVLGSMRYSLDVHPDYDASFPFVVPVRVSGESSFILFAVWAHTTDTVHYTDYVLRGLQRYEHLMRGTVVVLGDFHASESLAIPAGAATFEELLAWLRAHHLESMHHYLIEEEFGAEEHPTVAYRRDLASTHYVDYLFTYVRHMRGCMGCSPVSDSDLALSEHRPVYFSPGIPRVGRFRPSTRGNPRTLLRRWYNWLSLPE